MPAPENKAGASKADGADKPDTGEATTSTSTTDASTTAGRAAAGVPGPTGTVLDGATNPPAGDGVQRVEVVQAPAEPAVFYGEDAQQPAPRDHVKADYKPFVW